MNMESLGSAFSGLPYFNPMMMVNTSETCAATKLIQCKQMGITTLDVSSKFYRSHENTTDLSKDEFFARKSVIAQVDKNRWTPILYRYEVS